VEGTTKKIRVRQTSRDNSISIQVSKYLERRLREWTNFTQVFKNLSTKNESFNFTCCHPAPEKTEKKILGSSPQ